MILLEKDVKKNNVVISLSFFHDNNHLGFVTCFSLLILSKRDYKWSLCE